MKRCLLLILGLVMTPAPLSTGYKRLNILNSRHVPHQNAELEAILNELANGTARLEYAIDSARRLTHLKLTQARARRDLYNAMAQHQAWLE